LTGATFGCLHSKSMAWKSQFQGRFSVNTTENFADDSQNSPAQVLPATDDSARRKWWALAVVGIAQLMIVLDLAVVFVALPSIQRSLGIATADRQWVISAYAIPFGGLLLLGGRLVDGFGRKRTFVWAMIAFGAASALGGAAPSGGLLFAARAIQGSMAAVVAPAILSLVSVTFTERTERPKAFAIYGMIAASGAALGLILGGLLTHYASWRWCFLINVPLAIVAASAAAVVLRSDTGSRRPSYDIAGSVTATLGLVGLAQGFTSAGSAGWRSTSALAAFAIAIVMLGCFAVIESRSRSPLLPPRVVAEFHRAMLYLAGFLADAAQLSMFLFLTYYFQVADGYNALRTGFAFLPFALAVILTAFLSGRPFVRASPLSLMLTGAALSTLALLALSTLGAHEPYVTRVMLPEIVMGMGVALSLVPMNNVVLAGISPQDAGVASAALSATGQMGASMGSALLNSVFVTSVAGYLAISIHHGDLTGASAYGNDIVFRCEAGMYATAFGLIALAAWHVRRSAGQRSGRGQDAGR